MTKTQDPNPMSELSLSPRVARSRIVRSRIDKLGLFLALIVFVGLYLQPFALVRANRILAPQARRLWESLPASGVASTLIGLSLTLVVLAAPVKARLRVIAIVAATLLLLLAMGHAGAFLSPPDSPFARVSPGSGFWIVFAAYLIAIADGLVRLRLGPVARLWALAAAVLGIGAFLALGAWDDLSILKEYRTHADVFWREAGNHVFLAGGSLAAAAAVGIPLGILCYRFAPVRSSVLNILNVVQTIPSIALFGLLMAPLAWIAAKVPGASALGIAGIGPAPAFIALFAYALLPIVSNTAAGLAGIPPQARDAAMGVGMTSAQRLFQVELPLALPVILTGIRVVLVQNIGLAVIAALIGGGGLGVFIFQGINQTATDLVLMGTLPVVAMAFVAAILLDALVDLNRATDSRRAET